MKFIKTLSILTLIISLTNCSEDALDNPLADFQFSVNGTQVTFNGTVKNATTILWDFGDGTTSDEEDPIYAYAHAGTYKVVMTVTGENGTFSETKEITILPSLKILLTGGQANTDGKSWRLKKAYTSGKEGVGLVEDDLGLLLPSQDNILDLVGLGASYQDTFTFVYDGSYKVDNKDGQSLMGLVYANIFHADNITKVSYDVNNVPLANVTYTPKTDATWKIEEGDFNIEAATGTVSFTDKTHLILDEYLGFKDSQVLVIIKEITETTMNVALGINTDPAVYDKPTLLFHLTFEAL